MARNAISSHTRAMLEGRIVPTLLLMAWPNILVMVAQSASGLIETSFVSRLGPASFITDLTLPAEVWLPVAAA